MIHCDEAQFIDIFLSWIMLSITSKNFSPSPSCSRDRVPCAILTSCIHLCLPLKPMLHFELTFERGLRFGLNPCFPVGGYHFSTTCQRGCPSSVEQLAEHTWGPWCVPLLVCGHYRHTVMKWGGPILPLPFFRRILAFLVPLTCIYILEISCRHLKKSLNLSVNVGRTDTVCGVLGTYISCLLRFLWFLSSAVCTFSTNCTSFQGDFTLKWLITSATILFPNRTSTCEAYAQCNPNIAPLGYLILFSSCPNPDTSLLQNFPNFLIF